MTGKSTRDFKDRDWDAYRNHSIGFVFQSYNLIPHQTVLSNVELALTISGISGAERRSRAAKALEQVGLGDQLHKHPSEMSGGQMQRVAIARALANDPEILLCDEPTGALDTATSIQIMDLIQSVAKDPAGYHGHSQPGNCGKIRRPDHPVPGRQNHFRQPSSPGAAQAGPVYPEKDQHELFHRPQALL